MQNISPVQSELPTILGKQFDSLPEDLFIPPNALELCLESFSGPMDLLLYLIRKENINILDLNISSITDQYLEYIEMVDSFKFELAADYLVMAATLAEIKSRLMLPKESSEEYEDDPRAELIRRLQEYQRYKSVAEKIALLPLVDRDFYTASAQIPNVEPLEKKKFIISEHELISTIKEVLNRPNYKSNHLIDFEELSTQERIQIILEFLKENKILSFSKTLRKSEGKKGVVVTLLASLELAKDGYIDLIQNRSEELFIKSKRSSSFGS